MNHRRAIGFLGVLVILTAVGWGVRDTSSAAASVGENSYLAGRNVNMVSGTTLPWGDPWLQRQNEPSIAVSTRNPMHLLAGANDYRTVDYPLTEGELPGLPEGSASGDAWLGIYKSIDGGESWLTTLLPGFPQDASGINTDLKPYGVAADPVVRAGAAGLFYYSGIGFNRVTPRKSCVFVARYQDENNTESADPIVFRDISLVQTSGSELEFIDKPWLAVDKPRVPGTLSLDGQSIPVFNVYLAYSVFYGATSTSGGAIMFSRSTTSGQTWGTPVKLVETTGKQGLNQGACVAVDPKSGAVYVAWRNFDKNLKKADIYVAKSTNYGQSFGTPVQVAKNLKSFDQGTTGITFRTSAYPTLAVDGSGVVYLAWSERVRGEKGPGTIQMTTSANGTSWAKPWEVEAVSPGHQEGHQFMPSLTFASGKVVLAWYDQRDDVSGMYTEYIDESYPIRRTVDVRVALGSPGLSPAFEPSIQVSRYLYVLVQQTGGYGVAQAQFNPPDYPLFKGGTSPFHGDYLDVAGSPAFVLKNGSWEFNTETENTPVFHVTWTDNRDVRPPVDNNWTNYTPPSSDQGAYGEHGCSSAVDRMGMRNQNIYTAKISKFEAGAEENYKTLGQNLGFYPSGDLIPRAFVLYVKNPAEEMKSFRLSVYSLESVDRASFKEFKDISLLDVKVAPYSSVSRPLFVSSTSPQGSVTVLVQEIDHPGGSVVPGGLTTYVYINSDPTNPEIPGGDPTKNEETHTPNIENPNIASWDVINPNVMNPNVMSPNVANPNVMNPNIASPNVASPNVANPNVANPNIMSPNIASPNVANPNVMNPNVMNPNIMSASLDGAEVKDVVWKVTNGGNTASSYTFKTFSKKQIPAGIYAQLLVYRVHKVPGVLYSTGGSSGTIQDCHLREEEQDELLLNVANPNIGNPNVANPNVANPNVENPNIENATFSVPPGGEVTVVLRVVNPTPTKVLAMANGTTFDLEDFCESVGAAATAQTVNTIEAQTGVTTPPVIATKLIIATAALPDGKVNDPYSGMLEAAGGTPPYYWTLNAGEIPAGLTLDSGTGVISGTPTIDNTFNFIIQVQDSGGQIDTQRYSIYVYSGTPSPLSIVTTSLPSGVQGVFYGATLVATGGVYPRVWSLDSGSLPPGLSLDSGGVISGIPSATGTSNFTVRVTDNGIPTATATKNLSISIAAFTSTVTISGTAYDSMHFPLKDVLLRGLPGPPMTGDDGTYTATVPKGWSGTVIPFKVGYSFDPESRTYTDIIGNATNQDYDSTETLVSEEWVQRYSGPASVSEDHANAMAMDSTGNFFVTGYSDQGSTRYDYMTIKYDKFGNKLAEARFVGPYYMDWAYAITVDASDNVYVTGFSYGLNPNLVVDIVTIKYDNALNQLAIRRTTAPSGDIEPVSIVTDPSGNVYVAGTSYQYTTIATYDFVTIKYDSSLNENWVRYYSVSGTSRDEAMGIAVDASGGVYVTGTTLDGGGAGDIVTIKYDASGTFQWADIFNGSGNANDRPVGIAVNSAGDLYLAGAAYSTGTNNDYLIRKYKVDGTILWTTVHNYGGTSNEYASAMAVDSTDNIYVTGYGSGGPPGKRSETIKVNPSGSVLWSSWQDFPTYPSSITVDSSSNVYLGGDGIVPPGNYDGFVVVKLNSSGALVWTGYEDPGSKGGYLQTVQVGVDGSGNAFLSGTAAASGTGNDYYTVMFDSSGATAWSQRYDGPPNNPVFIAMAMDPLGNVVTLGASDDATTFSDFVTTKYSDAGSVLWSMRYDGPSHGNDTPYAMAIDAAGNIYVAGLADGLITVIKYDAADGHELWAAPATHAGTLNRGRACLAFDSAGNLYLVGSINGSGGSDYLLLKFNPATGGITGDWTYDSVVGGTSGNDRGIGIAIDAADNIYLTGQSRISPSSNFDIMTIKFDTSLGTATWEARYDGPGHGSDSPFSISTDDLGNVIVLGNSPGAAFDSDMVTIKYSSMGTQLWVDRFDGAAHASDSAYGLAVDAAGNIHVTGGSSESSSSGMQDYITIKYSPGGTRLWERLYDSGYMINDTAQDIGLDDHGNVYVTGMSQAAEGSSDYATLKYDSAGHLIWVIRYNGPGHSSDYGYALRIGPPGANYPVYVVGSSEGAGTEGMSIALIKYKQK
jgi:uncharacterized delta-60 repeat protein